MERILIASMLVCVGLCAVQYKVVDFAAKCKSNELHGIELKIQRIYR